MNFYKLIISVQTNFNDFFKWIQAQNACSKFEGKRETFCNFAWHFKAFVTHVVNDQHCKNTQKIIRKGKSIERLVHRRKKLAS